ncbi:MAG: hydrogenase maturation protease [Rhodobacteraceae bacterium]|nr:hydrogenase maturation protease [Paracoccaceae bacterium]
MNEADRPLVIGVGNLHAGDDAAGRLVAQRLAAKNPGFDVFESFGAAADLVTAFEGRAHVLVVDACLSGAAIGSIHRFDAHTDKLPDYLNAVSSHGIGVAQGVELARALGMLPQTCEVIAIEGRNFATGAPVSARVTASIAACVSEIHNRFSPPSPRPPAPQ